MSNKYIASGNRKFQSKKIGSSETLVNQVYRYLVELIDNQLLRFGQQLPSEPELAKQLSVSRFSLREALQRLETEEYILKRRGIGTFVNKPSVHSIQFGFEKLHSLSGSLLSEGSKPGVKELKIKKELPDKSIQKKLNLKFDEKINVIERIRTRDGKVFNYSVDYLINKIVDENIDAKNLGFSLYKFLEVNLGIFISYSKAEVSPYQADEFLAKKLSIHVGDLLTKVSQLHYLENEEPVMYSIEYFPKDLFTISIIRRR